MKLRPNRPAASFAARLLALLQLAVGVVLWPVVAHAACEQGSNGAIAYNVTMPAQVTIPRDAPVGTVLAEGQQTLSWNATTPTGVWCSSDATAIYTNAIGGPSTNRVMPTGIPGVGYVLFHSGNAQGSNTGTFTLPYQQYFAASSCGLSGASKCYALFGSPVIIQIVKTGPISGAYTLPAGLYFSATVGGLEASTVSVANPIQIVGQTCSVTTPSISVDLGAVPSRTFSTVGSTSDQVPFRIGVDCTGVTTNVGVTFTDVTNPGNATNTLSLTPASTAAGVGIQILTPASAIVQYGPDDTVAGNPGQVMLGTISNAVQNLTFNGRYVKTAETITPGSADGIATFTMSYQ